MSRPTQNFSWDLFPLDSACAKTLDKSSMTTKSHRLDLSFAKIWFILIENNYRVNFILNSANVHQFRPKGTLTLDITRYMTIEGITPWRGSQVPTVPSFFFEDMRFRRVIPNFARELRELWELSLTSPTWWNFCYYGDVTFATTRGSKIASSNESEHSSATR